MRQAAAETRFSSTLSLMERCASTSRAVALPDRLSASDASPHVVAGAGASVRGRTHGGQDADQGATGRRWCDCLLALASEVVTDPGDLVEPLQSAERGATEAKAWPCQAKLGACTMSCYDDLGSDTRKVRRHERGKDGLDCAA